MLPDTAVCGVFGLDNTEIMEVKKMRFNWEEFKDADNKIAVHCKTEEEAKDFCKRMHEHGMRWRAGESYLEFTGYEKYLSEICYKGTRGFGYYDFYKNIGYRILEWSDYMNEEFTKADLESGMVVEYRYEHMGKRIVIGEMLVGKDGYSMLEEYNDDLKKVKGSDELDIIKVYKIKDACRFENIMKDSNLELIWERTESKKMTVEEMRKKLEELTGEQIEVTA